MKRTIRYPWICLALTAALLSGCSQPEEELIPIPEPYYPPEEVAVGEVLLVRPGEKIPLDGCVLSGFSDLNTVALTGESIPRSVGVGDTVGLAVARAAVRRAMVWVPTLPSTVRPYCF